VQRAAQPCDRTKATGTEPRPIRAIREANRLGGDQLEAYPWATAKKRKVGVAIKMLRLTTDIQTQVAELIESACWQYRPIWSFQVGPYCFMGRIINSRKHPMSSN
jgi:hypothetical protein